MKDEGSIKFNCHWIEEEPLDDACIEKLNQWRERLYTLHLIGVTEDGIGYGNMSLRFEEDQFIITGSGTGRLEKLSSRHYTKVTDYNFGQNSVTTAGPIIASSESLTHAAIYKTKKDINAVFHVHHHALWKKLLKTLPSTAKDILYGTPEMAIEVIRLIQETKQAGINIFAMAGHEDGILAFGQDPDEAGRILLSHYLLPPPPPA
ncbi:MAG TPA: class II aldolase/adducin family protein [Puia sp.]|nr:class II aldolase/adducin family protein [Puia sp.]